VDVACPAERDGKSKLAMGETTASTGATSKIDVAFISGPLDADEKYFHTWYRAHIDVAIASDHAFVLGPVAGIDTLALTYLLEHGVSGSRITVFMANFEGADKERRERFEGLGVEIQIVREAMTTGERDAKMTEQSDYDVLRYRTEEEAKRVYGEAWWPRVSNTEMNERRRRGVGSQAYRLDGGEGNGSVRVVDERDGRERGGFMGRVRRVFSWKR
jgi:hypothetical protein